MEPASAPGASLRRCLQLSPPSLETADHRHMPPSQAQLDRTGTTKFSQLDARGRGDNDEGRETPRLRVEGRKTPLLPARETSETLYYATLRAGSKTKHLSARRGAHQQMSDLWGVGKENGSLPVFPTAPHRFSRRYLPWICK